jgi:ABC-type glycerol-3-phosphate transport system permease component
MSPRLSEERLADAHAHHVREINLVRHVISVCVLSFFALIVLMPFFYMVTISLKSAAEVGSGRLLPRAVVDLFTLGDTSQVWVEAQLTPAQSAAILGSGELFVSVVGQETKSPAQVMSLRLKSPDEPYVEALLEAVGSGDAPPAPGSRAEVQFRVNDGEEWDTVAAVVAPRNLAGMLDRLTVNYQRLINWEVFSQGRMLQWVANGFPRWYVNSLFVAFATVMLGLFFDSLAGFAFAKFDFPFRSLLFGILVATIMIPYPVTLVPTFFLFASMGFYNTYAALIVPGMVSAFGIFLVRQYVHSIPNELLDAARVDGASDFSVYRFVILPTARPILAALAVFRFIWQWNSYLYPLVLTNRDSMKTVQLGLATMQDAYGTVDYGMQMAGASLAVIPILTVYAVMQKHFIHGITLGSVKA